MAICYPLFLTALTIFVTFRFNAIVHKDRMINVPVRIVFITVFLVFLSYSRVPPGGSNDVYHEAQIIIGKDSAEESNPVLAHKNMGGYGDFHDFYGLRPMRPYDGTNGNILYINPAHWDTADIQNSFDSLFRNTGKLVRLKVRNNRFIFKVELH
jgi:hypothetical protein